MDGGLDPELLHLCGTLLTGGQGCPPVDHPSCMTSGDSTSKEGIESTNKGFSLHLEEAMELQEVRNSC